jgi:hypothetical protein
MKNQGEDNIKVYLRVRPFNDKEQNTESSLSRVDDKFVKVKDK